MTPPHAHSHSTAHPQEGGLWENIKTVIYALLIALVLRTVLVQPFHIPSGSMLPNLLIGDYIFVSKWAYGYSKHSILFSPPVGEGRLFGKTPARGDVAVFKAPGHGRRDYIKRVIGLPGDRVQMRHGQLYINRKPVKREELSMGTITGPYGELRKVRRWRETLDNGTSYVTFDMINESAADNTMEYSVPEGHVFMMGDNRDNSSDSRLEADGFAYVPIENMVGKAEVVMFSNTDSLTWWNPISWVMSLRGNRFFHHIP